MRAVSCHLHNSGPRPGLCRIECVATRPTFRGGLRGFMGPRATHKAGWIGNGMNHVVMLRERNWIDGAVARVVE
jgi:hypothetical protein